MPPQVEGESPQATRVRLPQVPSKASTRTGNVVGREVPSGHVRKVTDPVHVATKLYQMSFPAVGAQAQGGAEVLAPMVVAGQFSPSLSGIALAHSSFGGAPATAHSGKTSRRNSPMAVEGQAAPTRIVVAVPAVAVNLTSLDSAWK